MVSLMVVAAHHRRAVEEVCEGQGITHDQYNVLRILRGVHPQGHPRYAITERLIDRSPDVTRLLDRLERGGLVERFRSDEDRRLSLTRITRKGLGLLKQLDPKLLQVHERFSGDLTERDLKSLSRILSRVPLEP